jgi:hypothetical protein
MPYYQNPAFYRVLGALLSVFLSDTLGKVFTECLSSFAECFQHSQSA